MPYLNPRGIPLIILTVDWQSLVLCHFLFVVFLCGEFLTASRFAVRNSVAVAGVVVAFHNKILAAPLALSEANVILKHLAQLKLKNFLRGRKAVSAR